MRIGVLASHGGSVLQAIIDSCSSGELQAEVVVVVSNNSQAGALERARRHDIKPVHLSNQTHPDPAALDSAIASELQNAGVDWVVLAGYMKKLGPKTLEIFRDRILNTHPALLPKFGGAGFFGRRVHKAVLDARAAYPTSSLADLYDPDIMPADLRKAHAALDTAVDRLYRPAPFASDRDRVEHLFGRYEERMDEALAAPSGPLPELEDIWLQLHLVFECIWDYRFLYRDLVEIVARNRRLRMRFAHTPSLTGTLEHWQHDSFIVRWDERWLNADAFITFSLDEDGAPREARMKAVSPNTDFSFDFQDLLLAPAPTEKHR